MRRILVTGGAGFIGSHLVPLLARDGHAIRVLDTLSPQVHGDVPTGVDWLTQTDGVEFQRGSVCSRADLMRALEGIDSVVHLASETGTGQSMYEIRRYCDQNVLGTATLMDVLANEPARVVRDIVLASSRSVYGEGAYVRPDDPTGARLVPAPRSAEALRAGQWEPVCPNTGRPLEPVPTHEDDRTMPSSVYAATKLMQEDLVRIGASSLGIGFGVLRLQNVYGEGQSLANPYTGILSIFSTRVRRGLGLPIYEDGAETRDFVHVSDVARAFVAALRRSEPLNCVVNVGSGIGTPVLTVAHELCRAFGVTVDIVITGQYRMGDIRHNCADIGRLQHLLGVSPEIALEDGLRRFVDWVRRQPLPEDKLAKATAEMAHRKLMG